MRTYVRSGQFGMRLGCVGTVVLGAVIVLVAEAAAALGVIALAVAAVISAAYGVRYLVQRRSHPRLPRAPRAARLPGQPMWPKPLREDRRPDRR
jgi:O-antigen/teichoic acid export membrane protein